jgi:hypothetical protein
MELALFSSVMSIKLYIYILNAYTAVRPDGLQQAMHD